MRYIKWLMKYGLLMSVFLLASCARLSNYSEPDTTNKTAHRIYKVLPKYAEAAKEGWPQIHANLPLKVGSVSPAVPQIRHRLIVLDDMGKQNASDNQQFDSSLAEGVKQFQWRHGLRSTGVVEQKTLDELNVNPSKRYKLLVQSMYDWAKLPEDEGSNYIHVNIPSYKLYLVKDGHRVMDMRVIAGRRDRQTPTLYSKVKTIVFNPTWTVPKTIIAQDVIPGMQKNPHYMAEHYNMKLYANWNKNAPEIDPLTVNWQNMSASSFPYRITAPPGDENPLGRVKFVFENEHDVYMHDTPSKGLFNSIERAYSSGCIRLEKPFHLVSYFYDDNSDLDPALVNEYLSSNQTKYVALKNPIPIKITYITAWVDANGKAHFREDIYEEKKSA